MANPAPAAPIAPATPAPAPVQAPGTVPAPPAAPGAQPSNKEAQAAASDAAIKRYKLQMEGGGEEEVDEPELIKRASKATTAEKRIAESNKLKSQVDELLRRARDPREVWQVLEVLGHKPRKVAEDYLIEILNEEKMTPEQKQVRQAQEIIKRDEDRKRAEQTNAQSQRDQELSSRYTTEYSNQIIGALQKNSLPKSEATVRQMAYYMHQGLKRGVNLSADDVAPLVKTHFMRQITDLLGATDSDTLLSLVGENVAGKIREADLKRLQNPRPPVPASAQPKPGGGVPGAKRPTMTMAEFQAQNEKIKRGQA